MRLGKERIFGKARMGIMGGGEVGRYMGVRGKEMG